MRKLAAEFFGTFALVFAGTGAVVINNTSGWRVAGFRAYGELTSDTKEKKLGGSRG